MISAQADQVAQDALIEKYMVLPNQVGIIIGYILTIKFTKSTSFD